MAQHRVILHVDMDAFFASVEQLDHPDLRGKPVLVGHDGSRGVVAAASYEARRYGCHSAQPMAVAKRMCPDAMIMPGRGARYRELSKQVFAILESFTDRVQPLSIDEAFLDLAGCERLHGDARTTAIKIKQQVREETGLTASVGGGPNKFLAKLASDLEKPDGLVIIKPEEIDAVLLPLPVTRIWGVGPAAAAQLEKGGIRTVAQLRAMSQNQLQRVFGSLGERFYRLSRGLDDREVTPDHVAKSIGEENTFGQDVTDQAHVRQTLLHHVEHVARRLRRSDLKARRVTIKIRYGDFETVTRSVTLESPTDVTRTLWEAAFELFDQWARKGFRPVRLIGMTAGRLTRGGEQMSLYSDESTDTQRQVDRATDRIVEKFGKRAIRRGL